MYVKLEKLKFYCYIVHLGGHMQDKCTFFEHICKKFEAILNRRIAVIV